MKKLNYLLYLLLFLTLGSCHSIGNGVKIIAKGCKVLSVSKNDSVAEEKDKDLEDSRSSFILPINSWDGKMLIW